MTEKPAAPIKRIKPIQKKLKPAPVAGVSNPEPKIRGGGCDLAYIKSRESGGDYQAANSAGYYGAYQYSDSTWNGYGGYSRASDAPPSVQDRRASEDLAAGKQSQWSVC